MSTKEEKESVWEAGTTQCPDTGGGYITICICDRIIALKDVHFLIPRQIGYLVKGS